MVTPVSETFISLTTPNKIKRFMRIMLVCLIKIGNKLITIKWIYCIWIRVKDIKRFLFLRFSNRIENRVIFTLYCSYL